jgi:hypothetical protein
MKLGYMAVGNYGTTFHGLTNPRKEICERMGRKHASKVYRDNSKGEAVHVGYIVGGEWFTVYQVHTFKD